jgi:hypothetical protein
MAGGGIAALGLAGFAGYEWPHSGAEPSRATAPDDALDVGVRTFVTRPDLRPPSVTVAFGSQAGTDRAAGASRVSAGSSLPRFVLISPRHDTPGPSQQGLMVLDRQGHLVWFKPMGDDELPFDFDVQGLSGQPVLTWWQGEVIAGHGRGVDKIGDSSYRPVESVQAGRGLVADLHEFNLTSAGTALVTAYSEETADLSSVGGARRGKLWVGHAQEIDLATGKVLLDWSSLSHVPIAESYEAVPGSKGATWDYFHINSISELPGGDLLVSARNTWSLYRIDRSSGRVVWRMNGKRSDFTLGPGAQFYWQHDARMPDATTLTVFDDGSDPSEEKQSRALLLDVDTASMHVGLRRAYLHPAGFIAANQGSVQLLADGRVFVGWGNQPYFSEFAPDGTLLLDGQLPFGVRSYRAYLRDWVGRPADRPAIAARANPSGGSIVYVSWNGATEVDSWQILAGSTKSSLRALGSQEWSGFETAVAVNSNGPWFAAVALDQGGAELGRSSPVRTGATASP